MAMGPGVTREAAPAAVADAGQGWSPATLKRERGVVVVVILMVLSDFGDGEDDVGGGWWCRWG